MGRQRRPLEELGRETVALFFRGDLAREQQPQNGLGRRLAVAGRALEGREELLALGDRVAPESNSFRGVEERRLPEHAPNSPSAADALVDRDLAQYLRAVVRLQSLEFFLLLRDLGREGLLERRVRAGLRDGAGTAQQLCRPRGA